LYFVAQLLVLPNGSMRDQKTLHLGNNQHIGYLDAVIQLLGIGNVVKDKLFGKAAYNVSKLLQVG
jgi:hypothetical protein